VSGAGERGGEGGGGWGGMGLGDWGVGGSGKGGLQGTWSCREICGLADACQVSVSRCVDCNIAKSCIQPCGVRQYGINAQHLVRVIIAQYKANLVLVYEIVASHFVLSVRSLLIGQRLMQSHFACGCPECETSGLARLDFLGTLHCHADGVRIGTRVDNKVIFELLVVRVIEHVHAGKDFLVAKARKVRNPREPLLGIVANQIVTAAGQRPLAFPARCGVAAGKLESQHGSLGTLWRFEFASPSPLLSGT